MSPAFISMIEQIIYYYAKFELEQLDEIYNSESLFNLNSFKIIIYNKTGVVT